jgi:hypothetical protein
LLFRLVPLTLAIASVGGGAWAATGGPGPGNSDSVYRPGKGCGDRNHIHYRKDECKQPH